MRAVLDPNVVISALLNRDGRPARVLRAWLEGAFELVMSESLLTELERALAYPKLRRRISAGEAEDVIELLRRSAELIDDPNEPPSIASADPDDDYLIALAETALAVLVSGDRHLLDLAEQLPVFSPAEFLERLR